MIANPMLKWVKKLLQGKSARNCRPSSWSMNRGTRSLRFTVETLEDRVTPTTFVVDNILDTAGSGSLGNVTLRYAVTNAVNGDSITFSPAIFNSTISLASTLPITTNVAIIGDGANMTIDGGAAVQDFNVSAAVTGATISGLTIQNGLSSTGSGINNSGVLTLTNDTIINNGAIGNFANYDGGGIYNSGTMTIIDSTIAGNASFFNGGGIFNTGSLTMRESTVTGNAAFTSGGGIDNFGTLSLTNDTIAYNIGWGNYSFVPFNGGGVANNGTMTMDNCIVTGNNNSDITGTYTGSFNLIGAAATGLSTSLANNGGETPTLALLPGSSAIAAGNPTLAGSLSQNAVISTPIVDVGAFQYSTQAAPTVTLNTGNLPYNATTLIIISGHKLRHRPDPRQRGFFSVVTSADNVTGVVTAATNTSLTVNLSGLSPASINQDLDAVVTVGTLNSGSPVQVATVGPFQAPPTVSANPANLPDSSMTLTINGTGFDGTTPGNNLVSFNLGVTGTVTASTTTTLTVTLTTPPTSLGALNAVVTTSGISSGAPVLVGTEVNGTWDVTDASVTGTPPGSASLSDVTLPYAVTNTLSGDTIVFDPTIYGSTITLTSTLSIAKNITIAGPGSSNIAVSGGGLVQVFNVTSAVTAATISGITIENGFLYGYGGRGGDIANAGTLTLADSTITGGSAQYGGGINNSGTLYLTDSTVAANTNGVFFSFGSGLSLTSAQRT